MVWRVYHVVIAVVVVVVVVVFFAVWGFGHFHGWHSGMYLPPISQQEKLQSALTQAAEQGELGAIDKIIFAGADPNYDDGIAMVNAVQNRHDDALDLMMKNGGKPICPVLGAAAYVGNIPLMERLIGMGAPLEGHNAKYGGDNNCSALRQAVEGGQVKAARFLVAHGANIHSRIRKIMPESEPIERARASGNQAMIAVLEGR